MIGKVSPNWLSLLLAFYLGIAGYPVSAADEAPPPQTVADPGIALEELALVLRPLTRDQLLVEADAWRKLLQEKAEEIARLEVAIKRGNAEIERAEKTLDLATEAKEQLESAMEKNRVATDEDVAGDATAEEAGSQALERIDELVESAANTSAERAARQLQDDTVTIEEKAQALDRAAEAVAREAESGKEQKLTLLEQVTLLRDDRKALIDRLRAVLDELALKTDESDADTLAKITDYQLYAKAVSGIKVDVEDTTSAWIVIKGWLLSDEGGRRLAVNIIKFLTIIVAAWIISRVVSSLVRHALMRISSTSRLLENFLVKSVRWIVMAVGLIMALAALEVSIGPLLAVVGAAGFVIAFALQDSLSNFASGLMILFFRPFDEGDVIDAGGISGKVQSMNLVSTTILTFDNKRMVVPNNKIWNDVITNATGVSERRVDMEFGIGYDDDIDKAHEILKEIITSHPKVLEEPEPVIRMHTLGDSSVNFIARPWAKTADYWDVYWDVTKAVKQRFDSEDIGIPFPQRDVHLYIEGRDDAVAAVLPRTGAAGAPQAEPSVRNDGGLDEA